MVSTRKGTYEAPPPKTPRRRSLNQEVAEADAIPRGKHDSASYWSGAESPDDAVSESAAVASSSDSASVLSSGSAKGWSGGSPEASSTTSAGGRINPDFSQSAAPVLHSIAITRTSLPAMAIGSSSLNETGTSSGSHDARDFVAASAVLPGPDTSSVVTAGDDRRVVVAGAGSVSLPSSGSSADTTYHVPEDVVNQFVLPKRFARRAYSSVNNFLETPARFFPLWFRQSIVTGEDATQATDTTQESSDAESDSDRSSGVMVLYQRPADAIASCAIMTELHEGSDEETVKTSSKKAGKRRQRSRSASRKSKQASGSGKARSSRAQPAGKQDHTTCPSSSDNIFSREDSVPKGLEASHGISSR